jgi:hypothetical protein
MNILPNELILLNDELQRAGTIPRLDLKGAIAGRVLSEGDYDKLIVTHRDSVSDALREADIIDENSTLLYLGKILSIDALFAEVEQGSETFRRFVIVEDKLFRNPEARREVLGQVLDYAKALRETDLERLSGSLLDEHRTWLDANDDLVKQALRDANFLLLICGDRIQPRLIEYVKHLKEQLDPLISADIALMSLAIFSNGIHHIFIPYVVALITAEQGTTIRVVVQNAEGDQLPTKVSVEEGTSSKKSRRDRIEMEALMKEIRKTGGDQSLAVAQTLIDYARKLGAEIKPGEASVSVRVKDPNTGSRSTVFVVTKNATFYVGWLDRWTANAGVSQEVAENYKQRLKQILGQDPTMIAIGGSSAPPLAEVGKHLEPILAEIATAIRALRHIDE